MRAETGHPDWGELKLLLLLKSDRNESTMDLT